jgi:splicing suppressor protein 51
LDSIVDKSFHKVDEQRWLHGISQTGTYKLLIESYRLRDEDEYKFRGDVAVTLDPTAPNSSRKHSNAFKRYLLKAEKREGLLPPWVTALHTKGCVNMGAEHPDYSRKGWVEKQNIIEHYGNPLFPCSFACLLSWSPKIESGGTGVRRQDKCR